MVQSDVGLFVPKSAWTRACDRVTTHQLHNTTDIQSTHLTNNTPKPTKPPKGYRAKSKPIYAQEEPTFAKLPYPVPFKTANQHHHNPTHTSSGGGASFDTQLPVNVGGQAAFDFISSYDAPASGVIDNSLNAAAFAGSSPSGGSFDFNTIPKGAPESAVETLREILNKNIPYSETVLDQDKYNKQVINVEYSNQGLATEDHHGQIHDTNSHQHATYGAPPLTTSSSSSSFASSTGFGDFHLNDQNNFNVQNTFGHHHQQDQQLHNANNYQAGADSNPVQQYEIPPDPRTYVPAFKPLGKAPLPAPYGRYGAPGGYALAPAQLVYQTHTVQTAYGHPVKLYRPAGTNNLNSHGGLGSAGGFGQGAAVAPPASLLPPTQYKGNQYLPPLSPSLPQAYGPPPPPGGPYNRRTYLGNNRRHFIHNKMHGKRSNWYRANAIAPRNSFGGPVALVKGPMIQSPPIAPTPTSIPMPAEVISTTKLQPIVVAEEGDEEVEQQQQPQQKVEEHVGQTEREQDTRGLDIEVQKSIGFELDGEGNPKEALPNFSPSAESASAKIRRNSVDGDFDLRQVEPRTPLATGPIYSRPYSQRRQQTPRKLYTFHRY